MDLQLKDRVIFISGGSRGIGRDIVLNLINEGARVSTCSRNIHDLEQLYSMLTPAQHHNLIISECNILDEIKINNAIKNTVIKWGRLDAIVANAGEGRLGGVLETPKKDWNSQFEIKIFSILNMVRPALPELVKSDAAKILIINAVTSKIPDSNMAAVSCSRAAEKNLAYMLAKDLAEKRICVNWINLGAIETDRQKERYKRSQTKMDYQSWLSKEVQRRNIPFGRFGKVSDVSPMALLLLSPLSSYITATGIDIARGLDSVP